MAITFDSVIQQILNELGAVKGATAADADTNFSATPSILTVIGPDFVPRMVQPALASVLSKTVETIASTPKHPERQRYADQTAGLANLDDIPRAGNTGERIIGVPRWVKDASNGRACLEATLDEVRSFTRFSSTVYEDFDPYLYAINDGRIEHTRTNVVLGVCVWTRPTVFTGDINIEEWHEAGIVAGTVRILATKESMFASLYTAANTRWDAHLADIRNYMNTDLYGKAQAAPSSK